MKKLSALILAAIMLLSAVPFSALAQNPAGGAVTKTVLSGSGNIRASGTCGDGLTWELTTGGVLTISGSGRITDGSCWKSCQSMITSVIIIEGVTGIGAYAFMNFSGMTGVELPESLTVIESGAFNGCSGLLDIVIPNGVTDIGTWAFGGCLQLRSVSIPVSVASIGDDAFRWCNTLKTVYYGGTQSQRESNLKIGMSNDPLLYAKWQYTNVELSSGTCGYGLSWELTAEGVLTISGKGEMIDASGWSGHKSAITSVIISAGVKGICANAFQDCTALTDVSIPGSVTGIGADAFSGCGMLANVSYGETPSYRNAALTAIGEHNDLLMNTNWHYSYPLPASGSSGDDLTWELNKSGFLTISGTGEITDAAGWADYRHLITAVFIIRGITGIGENAFEGYTQLASIAIPNSVIGIDSGAFNGCSSLTNTYYGGSQSQREEDLVSIGANNDALLNAAWHYNDSPMASGDCGLHLTWKLSTEGELTISGTGVMIADVGTMFNVWHSYRSVITSVVIEEGAATIGGSAFQNCTNLACVTICGSITDIRYGAFAGCSSLTDVRYGGTQSQRDAGLTIGGNNEPLLNAAWQYAGE